MEQDRGQRQDRVHSPGRRMRMVTRFTTSDLAERFGIDRDAAYGLVRFLLAMGAIERKGVRKPARGRGRGRV